MIKKTFLTALLLLTMYSVFVASFAPKWWHASQHEWQDNVIKAQRFLYTDKSLSENVIVGSSLSNRLVMDSLPGTYNLSFGGHSIFDGLYILAHLNKLPKNIFIEINFPFREEDKNFTSAVISPVLFYPKQKLLALREENQPLGILGNRLSDRVTSLLIGNLKMFLHLMPGKTSDHHEIEGELFSKMLKEQRDNYIKLPDQLQVTESFENLKSYLKIMEEKGVHVVFFEMPVNHELNHLPQPTLIRETFYKYFPESKYRYVPLPDLIQYHTTDGVHLTKEESLDYTAYFKSHLKEYFR